MTSRGSTVSASPPEPVSPQPPVPALARYESADRGRPRPPIRAGTTPCMWRLVPGFAPRFNRGPRRALSGHFFRRGFQGSAR